MENFSVNSFSNFFVTLFKKLKQAQLATCVFFLLPLSSPTVFATDNCIQDIWKAHGKNQNLTCTANDVRVAFAGNIRDVNGNALTQCVSGQTFSFIADFHVELNAQTRYDIGLYFSTDGDPNNNGALTGICDGNIIRPLAIDPATPMVVNLGSANFIQLDAAPDMCGDIDNAHNPQVVTVRVDNVVCMDRDGDGFLNLPNCTSWRIPGSNELCQTSFDAYPGSPSKCNCDPNFNIPILVEPGSIEVTKDVVGAASLPEPGGQFTYEVKIENSASFTSVTINKICDDKYGAVADLSTDTCAAGTLGSIDTTDCSVPQTILAGGTYTCQFKASVTGEPQTVTDTVTGSGVDEHDNPVSDSDSAQVSIADVAPTASVVKSFDSLLCSKVRYEVEVNNLSSTESLNLTQLIDDSFGNIATVQGNVKATTCSVPQSIAGGGQYTCTFDAEFCGASHNNKVTGTLKDNEDNTINQESNTVTVNVSAP